MPPFFFHIVFDLSNNPEKPLAITPAFADIFDTPDKKTQQRSTRNAAHKAQEHSNTDDKAAKSDLENDFDTTFPALAGSLKELDDFKYGQELPPNKRSGCRGFDDWRYGNVSLQKIDMISTMIRKEQERTKSKEHTIDGIAVGSGGLATKGRYEPTNLEQQDLGWGVVRLYRDADETPGLYDSTTTPKRLKNGGGLSRHGGFGGSPTVRDEDCTTLCILAVPSYLTPSDFLGFVGERTREEVSHFRMIRTERVNRYMVLMKFRSGKKARDWRKEWDGKVFNSTEPENCHVVFVKSIEFRSLEDNGQASSFPDMTNDPFTPARVASDSTTTSSPKVQPPSLQATAFNVKPVAPPTPALVELPTCPKWRGSGCPVCRYTQDDHGRRVHSFDAAAGLNECTVCRSDSNLWICLICGNVGCGRYDAAHAFLHYQDSSHCFAMDLNTQRVWDYASDGYVHRIVQNKSDGKLVELPAANGTSLPLDDITDDYLPREKLDSIGLEYTHLLTSQLESQRLYFEKKVERAADKASQATLAAKQSSESALEALAQLRDLKLAYEGLVKDAVPSLERDRDRALRKAEKFEGMARKLEKEWKEEKALGESLMERLRFLDVELGKLKEENSDLKEQNRDLGFFISGGEKLKEADLGEEVVEGTLSLPEADKGAGGKKKNKGKMKT
ncbi:hypothetical protein MMC13_005265 [Lambiella insularis]|nr:hypothetical protein [Lambiella insularis]